MLSAASWKWARATRSNTDASVAASPAFPPGSPPPESRMWPPWTTRINSCVLHFLYKVTKKQEKIIHVKLNSCIESEVWPSEEEEDQHTHLHVLLTIYTALWCTPRVSQSVQAFCGREKKASSWKEKSVGEIMVVIQAVKSGTCETNRKVSEDLSLSLSGRITVSQKKY